MFFLATADREGRPQCSYKGGAPGFVHVLGPMELCFPSYDGNGMYLSLGNVAGEPAHPACCSSTSSSPTGSASSGRATITDDPACWLATRAPSSPCHVAVDDVFPNCPRYIHRAGRPRAVGERPRRRRRGADRRVEVHAVFNEVLAADDPARVR